MTRWRAQGIAVVAWFAGALGLTFLMPESHGSWIALPNFPFLFVLVFGPAALVVTLATTVLVAAWRRLPVRVLAAIHVALALVLLCWLAVVSGG
jgi:hypothetical protein